MRELLVIFSTEHDKELLTHLAEEKGFRAKATDDVEIALQWLHAREFEVACVHNSVRDEDRRRVASALWHERADIPLVIYDFSETSAGHGTATLMNGVVPGADHFFGDDCRSHIDAVLEGVLTREERVQRDVLIVEDLDPSRDIICACVESPRIVAHGVSSAREALALLKEDPRRFSCIVSDVRMPEMDGRELIRIVRSDPQLQHLPIIVLTAYSSVDALVDCLAAGATGFLLKPPKIKDLQREIERGFRILERRANPRLLHGQAPHVLKQALFNKGFV